jgi:hypothetical protein
MALFMLRGDRSWMSISSFFLSLYHSLCTGVLVEEEEKADYIVNDRS